MKNQPYESFYKNMNFELATKCSFSYARDRIIMDIYLESSRISMKLNVKFLELENELNKKNKMKTENIKNEIYSKQNTEIVKASILVAREKKFTIEQTAKLILKDLEYNINKTT